jgi:general L-amino acid transport system permease protein
MSEQLLFLWQNLPNLLFGFPQARPGGLLLSGWLALISLVFGFGLALVIGSGRMSQYRLIRWLCLIYIELFRGLPLILLLFLIHQGLGGRRFGFDLSPYESAVLALTLYTSAYQAEIIRAGRQAVPRSFIDAARVMGASAWQIFWQIEVRHIFRVMLPALVGQAISLFKDTSVVVVLGVGELLTVARSVLGSDLSKTRYWVSLYLVVGLLYLSLALALSTLAKRWDKKQHHGDLFYSLSES